MKRIFVEAHKMTREMAKEYEVEIGNNVAAILKDGGISIRKMSMDLELDYSTIHGLVNRKSLGSTTLERVIEISSYLDVNIEDLYK